MKRQYLVVWIVGMFCLVFGFFGNITSTANQQHHIFTLAEALQKEGGSIQNWTIHASKSYSQITDEAEWTRLVESFQHHYEQFQWDYSQKNDQGLLTGHMKKDGYSIELRLSATPTNDTLQTYLIYEVTSHNWNKKQVNSAINGLSKFWNEEFAVQPQFFTSIEGDFSDTMVEDLSEKANQILVSLQAEKIESLQEEDFVSVSGYSKKLNNELANFHNMNVQIGLRNDGLGAKTTFVVGTPIITIEY
ncbi:YwmB family TATA-box binding protein [Bacillus litorisediminis]|uniref:YwmB family TATA-box binding protein n=1 Tax=Bacillus litorisediminis TaxID=2922713 RepID=UPI001FAD2574|nr:YwmB family TATA-box binding protein [Bacillus litorisediminis]